jgi:hypothetical protein
MKEALERMLEELRSPAEKSSEDNRKDPSSQEKTYPGKWDYYVETD